MTPLALLAADWHWREDQPQCRTDDFMQTQIKKALFVKDICEKHDIPLLIAGDVFDFWKPSPELLSIVLRSMPYFICIPGQHDLPRHNIDLFHKSGLSVMMESRKAHVILMQGEERHLEDFTVFGYPYGEYPKARRRRRNEKPSICMLHTQISDRQRMFETRNAYDVLEELTGYDLILSGDNHAQFFVEENNRILLNPGSITRQDADQIEHQPRVYLWYPNNTIEAIDIPVDFTVVVRTHIELQKEKDDRIDEYIDCMKAGYSVKLNFKGNLKEHMSINKTEDDVKSIVWEWFES